MFSSQPDNKMVKTTTNKDQPKWEKWKGKIKGIAEHYWLGTKLLGKNISITYRLSRGMMQGKMLTRRERRLLVQTSADLFRLIPFIIIVVVPFLEFALPFLLKLFPNMLPSTYAWKSEHEAAQAKRLKANIELARFLQDTLGEMETMIKKDKQVSRDEFVKFVSRVKSGEHISTEDVLRFSKLFQDDITIDKLNRTQLLAMNKYLSGGAIQAKTIQWQSTDNLRNLIWKRLDKIKMDDQIIAREGVDALSMEELVDAALTRGIKVEGQTKTQLRQQLTAWLALSLNESMPPSLLVLSRSFLLNQDFSKAPAEPAISESLRYIPEAATAEVEEELQHPEEETVERLRERLEELDKESRLAAAAREKAEQKAKTKGTEVVEEEDLDDIKEDVEELRTKQKTKPGKEKESKTLSSAIEGIIEDIEQDIKKIEPNPGTQALPPTPPPKN
eukprot:TRINITY_DN5343_c0_g1_i1.p1 TRINITY_DN5343_c0_g1~~TRINITY_DN5343_c0_g1_i1.p1  ORF type:complete len:506 (+),score=144.73 TRINITY_DN5343_c0_g1_i1:184-1518(+)